MGSPLGLSDLSRGNEFDANGRVTLKPRGLPSVSTDKGNLSTYKVIEGKAVESLFGGAQFSPYPEDENLSSGSITKMGTAGKIHSDEANDISINSLIQYCKQYPAMTLDYAHFAYLKNVGVYPNNRLIIARRFAGAVGNDLTYKGMGQPLATLVSYVPEDQDNFFAISFNEEWEEAAGSFEDILNEIGEDVKLSNDQKGGAGKMVSAAFNFVPMPSLMEGVQILVKQKLGLAGGGQGPGASPYGNPNLIREAKQRKVIPKGEAGSSLAAKFSIDMVIEYEQKFINGVDPTLVYMDILQNALTFGTSDATFEYSSALAKGATDIIGKLISGDIEGIVKAIYQFVDELLTAIISVVNDLVDKLIDPPEDENAPEDNRSDREKEIAKGEEYKTAIGNAFREYFKISVGTVISKYKIRLLGVANALSGSNSTPWHVTIGNPKKPIFSSGDMLCTEVNVSLGKILAFNDLPSSIRIELKLENARNMGAQEIFNRFNTGKGRSYKRYNKSFVESDDAVISQVKKLETEKKNQEKNSDTQKPTEKVENDPTKLANNAGSQPTDTKAPGDPNKSKSDIQNTGGAKTNNTTDDYDIQSGGLASDWGSSTYLISPTPPKPIDQQGTASVTNDPKTSASEQSTGSGEKFKAEIAAAFTDVIKANSTIPGVTQSASTLQQQQAAGVTGSQAPQPESLPAPIPLPEPDPRVDTEPEITIGADGKSTVVYPSGTTPPTESQTQTAAAENKQSAEMASKELTPDQAKKELERTEKRRSKIADMGNGDIVLSLQVQYERLSNTEDTIVRIEQELKNDPNLATSDPEGYKELIEELQDEKDSRDGTIKWIKDLEAEYKNRKIG